MINASAWLASIATPITRPASSRAVQRLESLGLKVVALEPKSHADVQRVLSKLGVLLDIAPAQGAERLWRLIDSSVQAAAQSLPPRAKGLRVYFEVSRGPYAAGATSFMGETLTRLGVQNIIPAALGPFPRINPEFVVRANPDLIMVGSRSADAMKSYPRMAEAARIMARCIVDKSS